MSKVRIGIYKALLLLLVVSCLPAQTSHAQATERFFPETGQTVSGRFLEYWETNGGLMQQGYPISAEMEVRSEIDGKTYTAQFFERAVFEKHPENARPYDVLLQLLGVVEYRERYPDGAPNQRANDEAGSVFFPETGKRVGGSFLVYFNQFGGVPQQGFPISDEFQERSDLDGKVRVVQYFERAVFEWNPENTPPYNVLLAQLGTFAYRDYQADNAPEPPLSEPALPAPLDPAKSQYFPKASGRYLVWNEGFVSGSYGQVQVEFDIRALDMATNRPIEVTVAPGNQTSFALDGSLVAWRSENYGCPNCMPNGIYATDVATDQQYSIAMDQEGTITLQNPTVAGRNVIWRELTQGQTQRLLSKNVDTGVVTVMRTGLSNTRDLTVNIENIQGDGRFAVWSELSSNPVPPPNPNDPAYESPFSVHGYDFSTDTHFIVPLEPIYSLSYPSYVFALDDDRLAISNRLGDLFMLDLRTNARQEIPFDMDVFGLQLYDDALLINTSFDPTDIWGLDVSNPQQGTVPLLAPDPNSHPSLWPRYTATVAGEWLVWSNYVGPERKLEKKKLDLVPGNTPLHGPLPGFPAPPKFRSQAIAAASDRYVLWWDCPASGLAGVQPPCWLRGFDTGNQSEVPAVPSVRSELAVEIDISGSLLVWRIAAPPDCTNCPETGIYALDLETNATHRVAISPIERYSVAVHGRTVVWAERENGTERVIGKNLDTGEFTNYREQNTLPFSIDFVAVSDDYIVWNEADTQQTEGLRSHIMAYDRRSGETSEVSAYNWDIAFGWTMRIALDQQRVAVKYGQNFFVRNLSTGEQIDLPAQGYVHWLRLRGNALLYSAAQIDPGPYGASVGTTIYGLNLSDPTNLLELVPGHIAGYESYEALLSGSWLVYHNRLAQRSRLLALRLPEMLSR